MSAQIKYVCPRCEYQTERKSSMKRHFYQLKNPCYSSTNSLVLTDNLKQSVLNLTHHQLSRPTAGIENTEIIYPDKTPIIHIQQINHHTQINQQLNNFYQMNNLISQASPITNLEQILNYTNDKLEDFDTTVESKYLKETGFLVNDQSKYVHVLTSNDLFNCINQATRISKPSQFNFLYDQDLVKIYTDGEWREYITPIGVNKIVETIQLNYLNDYELYLLRKIHQPMCNSKLVSTEHLEIYYKFLAVFDILPHVIDFSDQYLIGHQLKETDEYVIEKYATEKYYSLKRQLKQREIRATKTTVLKLIKNNSNRNIKDINLALLDILEVDPTYKLVVVNKYSKSRLL